MRKRSVIRVGLAVTALALASDCQSYYDTRDQIATFFGFGPSSPVTLQLLGFRIFSDHPALTTSAQAIAVVGTTVTFTAVGTFQDVNSLALGTAFITGTVLWSSSNPAITFPGADGKAFLLTTGTTVISASTPSVGTIPAFHSNAIILQSMP